MSVLLDEIRFELKMRWRAGHLGREEPVPVVEGERLDRGRGRAFPMPFEHGLFAPYPASPLLPSAMRLRKRTDPVPLAPYNRFDVPGWERYRDWREKPSPAQKRFVFERETYRCVMCHRQFSPHLLHRLVADHIIPWSHGGWTVVQNLQCACVECNLWKGDRLHDDLRDSPSPLLARIDLGVGDMDVLPRVDA